ncbi:MAG TPA: AAA family ATPase [Planctomycetota bacterium]|nr:AAA family ATPase [Planctomycetota bacterium]
MILDANGLNLAGLDDRLARALGNEPGQEGSAVLAKAVEQGCTRVHTRHWLYCLADMPGGLLRTHLIDTIGKDSQRFVRTIEMSLGPPEKGDGPPLMELTSETVTPEVREMLKAAEHLVDEHRTKTVTEPILTLALLEAGGDELRGVLESWATPEGLKRFKDLLHGRMAGALEELTRDDLFNTAHLGPNDVKDWPKLCAKLVGEVDDPRTDAAGRILGLLPPDVQKGLLEAVKTENCDAVRGTLRPVLNRLMERPDFHQARDFAELPRQEEPPLEDQWLKMTEQEVVLANRRMLEAAFPDEIVENPNPDGKLRQTLLDPTGHRLCRRLIEDMASLGTRQVTTYHLLYTLLGTESLLTRALTLRGVDVTKDLHTVLSRQLARAGTKRNTDFALTAETLLGSVTDLLLYAVQLARARGASAVAEADISRAFVHRSARTLQELFPKDKPLDPESLRNYMDTVEPEEAEEETPLQRFTIAEIEQAVNNRIRGESQAVAKVIPWIKRLRFGLSRDNRPAAVLLFLGPTGTGKTQMAKELARYVYGSEDALLFLEMGQFQTKESMSGFVGAPPGYVGYGDGKLTNGLRDKPECVVLFDEIEKAAVEVFDSLLRFADEGLISDPAGPVRDGSRCIIVMTTNAGQTWLQDEYFEIQQTTQDPDRLAERLAKARKDEHLPGNLLNAAKEQLKGKGFRPEFIGRVDELVTFLPLDLETCRYITEDILKTEAEKLMHLKGIELIVEEEALDSLAREAMLRSLAEGARGVPRTINERVINRLIDVVLPMEERGDTCRRLTVVTGRLKDKGLKEIVVEPVR